jgi:hypothetical protein
MKAAALACLLLLAPRIRAETLDLPPRAQAAPGGSELARSIAALPRRAREERILAEVLAGNVPPFLRRLVPVTVVAGDDVATYHVAPDYLAVGSNDDYVLMPLGPYTAQAIADRLGCTLPTPKMVDDIYAHAAVKLVPAPIAPSPAMTTIPIFLQHNQMVRTQRTQRGEPLGQLTAGHKKDVVIARRVFESPEMVGIYGWHRPDGTPIQPLYTGHTAAHVDYSHGVRLVLRTMTVGGAPKTVDEVLADPRFAPLLSNEGVLRQTRYAPARRSGARIQGPYPLPAALD